MMIKTNSKLNLRCPRCATGNLIAERQPLGKATLICLQCGFEPPNFEALALASHLNATMMNPNEFKAIRFGQS